MKNVLKAFGIIAIVAIMGFSFAACDDDGDGDDGGDKDDGTITYEGKDVSGNTYILTVTEKTGRAVYTPAEGDSYVLIIKITGQPDKKSSGAVKSVSVDGTFTLQPSVEGSGTFRIVINKEKISSVDGDIAIDGGGTITPRTFSTMYLRADRWTQDGSYGETWSTKNNIKLSDFYSGTLINNTTYTIKVSGKIDNTLEFSRINLFRILSDGYWQWLGNGPTTGFLEVSGVFNRSFAVRVNNNVNMADGEEIIIQLDNALWQKNPDGSYIFNNGITIPENIAQGTIMATISNFSISLVEE